MAHTAFDKGNEKSIAWRTAYVRAILLGLSFSFSATWVRAEAPHRPEGALPRGQEKALKALDDELQRAFPPSRNTVVKKEKPAECDYNFIEVPEASPRVLPKLGDYRVISIKAAPKPHVVWESPFILHVRVFTKQGTDRTRKRTQYRSVTPGIDLLREVIPDGAYLKAHLSPIEVGYFIAGGSDGLKAAYEEYEAGGPNPLDQLYQRAYEFMALLGSSTIQARDVGRSYEDCKNLSLRRRIQAREQRLEQMMETLYRNIPTARWDSQVGTLDKTASIEKVTIQEFEFAGGSVRKPKGDPVVVYVPAGVSALNYMSRPQEQTIQIMTKFEPRFEVTTESIFSEEHVADGVPTVLTPKILQAPIVDDYVGPDPTRGPYPQ